MTIPHHSLHHLIWGLPQVPAVPAVQRGIPHLQTVGMWNHTMKENTAQRIRMVPYMMTEAWNHTRPDIQIMGTIKSIHIWTVTATYMEPWIWEVEHITWTINCVFI